MESKIGSGKEKFIMYHAIVNVWSGFHVIKKLINIMLYRLL